MNRLTCYIHGWNSVQSECPSCLQMEVVKFANPKPSQGTYVDGQLAAIRSQLNRLEELLDKIYERMDVR